MINNHSIINNIVKYKNKFYVVVADSGFYKLIPYFFEGEMFIEVPLDTQFENVISRDLFYFYLKYVAKKRRCQ